MGERALADARAALVQRREVLVAQVARIDAALKRLEEGRSGASAVGVQAQEIQGQSLFADERFIAESISARVRAARDTAPLPAAPLPPKPPRPRDEPERRAIKIEMISDIDDRFRCKPLEQTMAVKLCLERQRIAGQTASTGSAPEDDEQRKLVSEYAVCRTCSLGRRVAARMGTGPSGATGAGARR